MFSSYFHQTISVIYGSLKHFNYVRFTKSVTNLSTDFQNGEEGKYDALH